MKLSDLIGNVLPLIKRGDGCSFTSYFCRRRRAKEEKLE
jgi:hypothetical protein